MTATDLMAVVVTVCVVVALAVLVAVLGQLYALARRLRAQADLFTRTALPAVARLAETTEAADVEIGRLRDAVNVVERFGAAAGAVAHAAGVPLDKLRSAAAAVADVLGDDRRRRPRRRD